MKTLPPLIQIGLVCGLISSVIVGAVVWGTVTVAERENITLAEFRQFCALRNIPAIECKVKKVYKVRTR